MPNQAVETIPAEHLPPEFRAKLRPIPGTRYRVTVEEIEETDAEKLEALRADLQKGRDQINAGLGVPAEKVFEELKKRFPASAR